MFLLKLIEIGHELVDRLFHVHVPDLRPNLVLFGQDVGPLFHNPHSGLDLVPAKRVTSSVHRLIFCGRFLPTCRKCRLAQVRGH